VLDLGEVAAARSLFDRALSIQFSALGPEHPNTAIALANLASAARRQGDLAEARGLLEGAERIFRSQLGEDDPATRSVGTTLQRM
jgi:hypothetical protein